MHFALFEQIVDVDMALWRTQLSKITTDLVRELRLRWYRLRTQRDRQQSVECGFPGSTKPQPRSCVLSISSFI